MAKYNYEALKDTYNKHKITSDSFCDGINQFTTTIHTFINIDDSDFNNKLAVNTKLYLQEVVIGAMEAILIGMERYTSLFFDLRDRAEKNLDPGDYYGNNTNLTTDGLMLAAGNNWSETASKLDTYRTGLNDIITELNALCGTTKVFEYTDIQTVYDKIYTKLDSVNISMHGFSAANETVMTDLGDLYTDIRSFVDLIKECVAEGKIEYAPNQLANLGWYKGYKERAIKAITAVGEDYFLDRALNPMSAIELEAFQNVLLNILETQPSELASEKLQKFFNPYDEDRVKFFAGYMIILAATGTDPQKQRQLITMAKFFFTVVNALEGLGDPRNLKIELLDGNKFVFKSCEYTFNEASEYHEVLMKFDIQIGLSEKGKSSDWMLQNEINSLKNKGNRDFNADFEDFIQAVLAGAVMGVVLAPIPGGYAILAGATIETIFSSADAYNQAKSNLDKASAFENSLVFNDFQLAIGYTKVGDVYGDYDVFFTPETDNLIKIINERVPGANVSRDSFYTQEGVTDAKNQIAVLRELYKDEVRAGLRARNISYNEDMIDQHWAMFLLKGGDYDYAK